MTEIMSAAEFKHGMMRLASAEGVPRSRVWRLVTAYMDADDDAKLDCSNWLRDDLATLDTEGRGSDG